MLKNLANLFVWGLLVLPLMFSACSGKSGGLDSNRSPSPPDNTVELVPGEPVDEFCGEQQVANSAICKDTNGKVSGVVRSDGANPAEQTIATTVLKLNTDVNNVTSTTIMLRNADQWKAGWDISAPRMEEIAELSNRSIIYGTDGNILQYFVVYYNQNGEQLVPPQASEATHVSATFIKDAASSGGFSVKDDEAFLKITFMYSILYFGGTGVDLASTTNYYVMPAIHIKHI